MDQTNRHKVVALLQAIGTGDEGPLSVISRTGFVQHDPELADGYAGYAAWLAQVPAGASVEVVRAFEDGDFVFVHSRYDLGEPRAVADIFRFENGAIVEHWNASQTMEAPNPSGRTILDGATELTDTDLTEQNKDLVRDFLTKHLVNGSDDVARFFDGDAYIQHNPGIADGVTGLLAAGKAYADKGVKARFSGIHRILGERNFVMAVSEGHVGDAHILFCDLYRIADGKLAEHWDILETIGPEGSARNGNGRF